MAAVNKKVGESAWRGAIDELRRRRHLGRQMGGEARVEVQHQHGKLTARERIDMLLDPGSFREIGVLAGVSQYDESGLRQESFTPANIVIGKGAIDGRRAMVSADDYTIRGGSSEATNPEKWQYAESEAVKWKVPLVRLVDMAGGSVRLLEQMQTTKLPLYQHWDWTGMLSVIPVVGLACGPCAGLGAQKVCASHFSLQVEGTGQVFAAGPRVVAPGVGQAIDKEALGGAGVHARHSGVVDNAAADEADAIRQIKRWLSFMPSNVHELPPIETPADDPGRAEEELLSVVPENRRRPYDGHRLLDLILDLGSVFEVGPEWGRGAITALARLNGKPVGVLAANSMYNGGAQGEHEAEKFTRFIDVCDTFHLPIINLHDQAGASIGGDAEARGTVRKVLRNLMAIEQSTVPWCTILVRRAYGMAGSGVGPWRGNTRVAWPSGHWGSLPIEGGVNAAFRREIEAAPDPDARRQELEDELRVYTSPFRTAERFLIQDVIDPRETRAFLCEWVDETYERLADDLGRKGRGFRG